MQLIVIRGCSAVLSPSRQREQADREYPAEGAPAGKDPRHSNARQGPAILCQPQPQMIDLIAIKRDYGSRMTR